MIPVFPVPPVLPVPLLEASEEVGKVNDVLLLIQLI